MIPELSIVLPVYNERANVGLLHKEIKEVMDKLGCEYEVIYVDDGSTDDTFEQLKSISGDPHTNIIHFRRNFGQTAAMSAGFKHARGNVVIAMDADLQNDPSDIPKLLEKMKEGYDVVSGWRWNRRDSLSKRYTSQFSNWLQRKVTGLTIHDSGCSLKAYRRECLQDLEIYGEMHRFIPAILAWKGFKIGEVLVSHNPRKYGKTKYNWKRLVKGFLDLLVVKFWMQYSARPIHLFGGIGLLLFGIGFICGMYLVLVKLITGAGISDRPLLLLGVFMMLAGWQSLAFGLISDVLSRLYYRGRTSYEID